MLNKLQVNGEDGYLWNRLGNLYNKGGRPELAAVAYERSLGADPLQVESHYSLSEILYQIDDLEQAAYHCRMMLASARRYDKLEALDLRELLAAGLQQGLDIHMFTDKEIPFMPSQEEMSTLDAFKETAAAGADMPKLALVDLDIDPDDRESLYPLAEMFMWLRRDEIPVEERTLDQHLPGNRERSQSKAQSKSQWHEIEREIDDMVSDAGVVHIYLRSEERAGKASQICEHFGIPNQIRVDRYSVEFVEELKQALTERLGAAGAYAPVPCGSGKKFKFCCSPKLKLFDVERFAEGLRGN